MLLDFLFQLCCSLPKDEKELKFDPWRPDVLSWTSFSYLAAAQLAMEHFNARDPSVVPELANLGECDVFFPPQKVVDSRCDGKAAVEALWDATKSDATDGDQWRPCAVLGPALAGPSMSLQSVTNALDIPQVMYYNENNLMYRPEVSNTLGTVMAMPGRARAMVEYLQRHGAQRDSLSILHEPIPDSMELAMTIKELTGPDYGLFVETFQDAKPPRGVTPEQHQFNLVRKMKKSGIKTIFINTVRSHNLEGLAGKLHDEGMLSGGYIYILAPHLVPTDAVAQVYGAQTPGSPLDQLLSGAMVFDTVDPYRVNPQDKFLVAWRQQNATFVDRCNTLSPLEPDDPYYFQADRDFFETTFPANFASFVYDATMLIGFGACREMGVGGGGLSPEKNGERPGNEDQMPPPGEDPRPTTGEGVPPPDQGDKPPSLRRHLETADQPKMPPAGPPLPPRNADVQAMINSAFSGASGPVSFRPHGGTRKYEDVTMGLYNIRPSDIDESTGTRVHEAVVTSLWTSNTGWKDIEETAFIFCDGTENMPTTTREIDGNYLSPFVRAVGLTLFGTAFFLGLGGLIAVWILTNDAVVKRSQPFFLKLICVGAIIMSVAILTLSFDEDAGWSDNQLDVACMLTPWFFFVGQIMVFSALFTKIWRVDQVLQFRRRAVTVKSVLGPLVVMLTLSLITLLVWTIVDPWTWERKWISQFPAETYGECRSDHFWAFFGPLIGLLVLSEGVTAFFAWKTSDVPEDFRDTNSVMQAICTHLQAWMVGLPILAVLGNSSAEATYFGRVLLIWIFAVSSVVVVIGPKVFGAIEMRLNPQLKKPNAHVRVSGIFSSHASVAAHRPSYSFNPSASAIEKTCLSSEFVSKESPPASPKVSPTPKVLAVTKLVVIPEQELPTIQDFSEQDGFVGERWNEARAEGDYFM
jgi:hypothetical protein